MRDGHFDRTPRNLTWLALGGLAVLLSPGAGFAFDHPLVPWAPATYVCPRLASAPVIDGVPDEAAWQAAPWSSPFTDIQGPLADPPRHLTHVRLGWDDTHLYVAARLDEPHVWATLSERDAVIYHDNDFELFIDPDSDNHLYGELEINALGTVWDLLLARPYRDGGPAIDAWDIAGLQSAVAIDGTLNDPSDVDRGWSVELAIPWHVLGAIAGRTCPPEPGDVWRLNFSRVQWRTEVAGGAYRKIVDERTGKPLPEDNWVWSPQGLIAMHCPEMWGEVLFDDGGGLGFEASPEHTRIAMATLLMPVYYRQRVFHEANGRFAATLAELGLGDERLPLWPDGPGLAARDMPMIPGFTLTLDGGDDWFRAGLATPLGTAVIDHTGRLERLP